MSKLDKILLFLFVCFISLDASAATGENSPPGGIAPPAVVRQSAAPVFAAVVDNLAGHPVALSEFKGQPLLINFWATWCGPCRKEIPDLIEMNAKYQPKGVVVVGIAVDSPEKVREFVKARGITYQVLVGPDQAIEIIKKTANATALIPFTLAIGPGGDIVAVRRGLMDRAELDRLLQSLVDAPL